MGLFGKKKLEEEFDELEESPRKIRDLKPQNRKKREEPPKPWGKVERYIVLFALLFTVITAIVLTLFASGVRLPKINIDLSQFNIFKETTIIVR